MDSAKYSKIATVQFQKQSTISGENGKTNLGDEFIEQPMSEEDYEQDRGILVSEANTISDK